MRLFSISSVLLLPSPEKWKRWTANQQMHARTSITFRGPSGPLELLFGETNQSQRVQCSKLAATSFHEPLSVADYLEREEYLAHRPLTQDGRLRYWCLALEKNPAQVLATCKTMQRDILVRDVNGSRQQQCYCIASVITDSQFRRNGLASLLLERVAKWMDGPGDATASMLYTSIGDVSVKTESCAPFVLLTQFQFYVRRGWKKIPAMKSTLSGLRGFSDLPDWSDRPATRLLSTRDIPALCARDVNNIKVSLENHAAGPNEVLMVVLPTSNLISWLHDRGDFISHKINGEIPDAHGAISESADSWLYWHHDFRKRALGIQRISASAVGNRISTASLSSLLFGALKEAYRWKLLEVHVWNPSHDLVQAIQYLQEKFGIEAECKEQTGSVPSVRWRGSEQARDIRLPLNEHYAWS